MPVVRNLSNLSNSTELSVKQQMQDCVVMHRLSISGPVNFVSRLCDITGNTLYITFYFHCAGKACSRLLASSWQSVNTNHLPTFLFPSQPKSQEQAFAT